MTCIAGHVARPHSAQALGDSAVSGQRCLASAKRLGALKGRRRRTPPGAFGSAAGEGRGSQSGLSDSAPPPRRAVGCSPLPAGPRGPNLQPPALPLPRARCSILPGPGPACCPLPSPDSAGGAPHSPDALGGGGKRLRGRSSAAAGRPRRRDGDSPPQPAQDPKPRPRIGVPPRT